MMQVSAPEQPPQILQIYREAIKPGQEAAYTAIEEDITWICFDLKCPHPYLGTESLSGPKEVWFFNGYRSEAAKQASYDAYARNATLMAALTEASNRKAALTDAPVEVFTSYRPDLTEGEPWLLGRGRFLVITITRGSAAGTVFEASDGTRFIFRAAATREEADAAAAKAGSDARVFAVRPTWSTPARAWVDADPRFWRAYPPVLPR